MRNKVFISYDDKDKKYLEELHVHLKPYIRKGIVDSWDTTKIAPGTNSNEERQRSLELARVAVLLVSAEYYASDFIARDELPQLLKASEEEGLIILCVIVRTFAFEDMETAHLRAVNEPSNPLSEMSRGKRDKVWALVTKLITKNLQESVSDLPHISTFTRSELKSSNKSITQNIEVRDKKQSDSTIAQIPIEERLRNVIFADQRITQLQMMGTHHHSLPLSKVYVPLRLSKKTEVHYFSQIPHRTNDPASFADLYKLLFYEYFQSTILPEDALRKYKRCVIVGGPGNGKTTLLRYLAASLMDQRLVNFPTIPLYVCLHEFIASGDESILGFVARTLSERREIHHTSEEEIYTFIIQEIEKNNVLLLLDDIDEIDRVTNQKNMRSQVIEEISEFAERGLWVVVTAQREENQHYYISTFTTLEILNFGEQEIEQFIDNWFRNCQGECYHYAQHLKQELKSNPQIQSLAFNPLSLMCITCLYEDQHKLPKERSSLYREYINLVLRQQYRNNQHQDNHIIKVQHQKKLLQEIAWHMQAQSLSFFQESEALQIVTDFLPKIGMIASKSKQVLQTISGDNGFLSRQSINTYNFLHPTFREYFAALYVQERGNETLLLDRLLDPWWKEVILLYVGTVNDSTNMLQQLLSKDGSEETPEDIFSTKLILAGYCVAIHSIPSNDVRMHILDELFKELVECRQILTNRHIAEVLAMIAQTHPEYNVNRHLLTLINDRQQNIDMRLFVIEALGQYAVSALPAELLKVLFGLDQEADNELAYGIAKVLLRLTDRSIFSQLWQVVTEQSAHLPIRILAAFLIAKAGDISTSEKIFLLLFQPHIDIKIRSALASSLTVIGDERLLLSLLSLITNPQTEAGIVQGIVDILPLHENHALIMNLFPHLSVLHVETSVRYHIALALLYVSEHVDKPLIDHLAKLIVDNSLELSIRTICTEIFVRSGLQTHQRTILDFLLDAALATSIRTTIMQSLGAIAVDLTLSQRRNLIEHLHSIRPNVLQPREVRDAITLGLGLLGDPMVFDLLQKMYLKGSIPKKFYLQIAEYITRRITSTEQVVALLTEDVSSGDIVVRGEMNIEIVHALATTNRIDLVPGLLKMLTNLSLSNELSIGIVKTIGVLGQQIDVVEQLLELWKQACSQKQHPEVVSAIYQAMHLVGKKVKVTIVLTGHSYRVVPYSRY